MAGAWTSLSPMPGGTRTQLGVAGFPGVTSAELAAMVPQGSLLSTAGVYAIGGFSKQSFLTRTERFDIVANAWTPMNDMPTARAQGAIVAAHRWIYAIGGFGGKDASTSVERFEPALGAGGTWTKLPGLKIGKWLLGAAAVTVSGHLRIYAIGGSTGAPSKTVEYLQVTPKGEGTWIAGPPLHVAREQFGIAVFGNAIYCIGGNSDVGAETSVEVLKPGASTWTLHQNVLTTARFAFGAAYSGGRVFAIGGVGPLGPVNTVEAFDAVTVKAVGTWAKLPAARTQFGSGTIPVFVLSPKDTIPLFVAGGSDINGNAVDTLYRFDLAP